VETKFQSVMKSTIITVSCPSHRVECVRFVGIRGWWESLRGTFSRSTSANLLLGHAESLHILSLLYSRT